MAAGLKIDGRRNRILEILNRDGRIIVSQLNRELGVTAATIRSDLEVLERDGYLERIQGGAVQKLQNLYNFENRARSRENGDEKRLIAAAAAELISDGDTLFVNSGSTALLTALALKKHKSLSIVTNSLPAAMGLSGVPTFRTVLLGGGIDPQYAFTYGSETREHLRRYRADFAILSVDGVSAGDGVTTHHAQEALIDAMMVERAKKTIVAADHTKLGHGGFSRICGAEDIWALATDPAADADACRKLRELGVRVIK